MMVAILLKTIQCTCPEGQQYGTQGPISRVRVIVITIEIIRRINHLLCVCILREKAQADRTKMDLFKAVSCFLLTVTTITK